MKSAAAKFFPIEPFITLAVFPWKFFLVEPFLVTGGIGGIINRIDDNVQYPDVTHPISGRGIRPLLLPVRLPGVEGSEDPSGPYA